MVEEAAAPSTPWATNLPAPGAAAVHFARQHTPAQTSRASRAVPGVLSAVKELLRHPPSSTASPGAMKQWRDDVDRLLDMAHSGSARPRPRSSWRQHEASASVRSPSNSTAGVRARMPVSLWKGHVSADRTSRVATSTTTSLRLHRRLQRAPGSRRVSPWPAWDAPRWRIISARQLGHPSSGHTCWRSTTVRQICRNSCRFTSPPLR
jgi:hypothetical protein